MKKPFPIFCVWLLAFSLCLPFTISADTDAEIQSRIDATKKERDALLEEQKKLQTALDELNTKGQTLQSTVKSLDATRTKLANDLKITQTNINSSNLVIQKLTNEINANEDDIETNREAIRTSLKKLSAYDEQSVVLHLFSGGRLDEVWQDATNLLSTQDALGEAISALESAQKKLLSNKTAKEGEKSKLVGLSSELSGQKKVVEATKDAQAKLLAETKNKEAEYQKMLLENMARAEEFDNQLSQYESQLKASDRSLLPAVKKGVLSWPLDKVVITQYFGYTAAARLLYKNTKHNGIDFRASVGTRVLSVRGGIVEGMGNTDEQRGCYSYGRWVLIKHDNGLSSIYAHLSAITVTTGQVVSTGQVIGYSGGQPRAYGSGASTGPHLHLGIYASQGVQIAQYLNSVNCKNISIPLANPQDYLDPLAYLPPL